MDDVVDLTVERRRRRDAKGVDMLVASCMNCGAEYPWGMRYDHRCDDNDAS